MNQDGKKKTPCRRFGLLDGLILVGFAAVGFAGCRGDRGHENVWFFQIQMFVEYFLMLGCWMVLVFRIGRPRPPLRLMARQPGVVACGAVVTMQLVGFVDQILNAMRADDLGAYSGVGQTIWLFFSNYTSTNGAVVPICWLLLIINRRWKPEPGWIDRSGRAIGVALIVWIFAWPILFLIADGVTVLGPGVMD